MTISRIRTQAQLFSYLSDELTWRKRELAEISSEIDTAKGTKRNALLRAGIPILYAHWEGFVKNACVAYATFLSKQRLVHSQIKSCFLAVPIKSELDAFGSATRPYRYAELTTKIFSLSNASVHIKLADYIENVGNLKFKLFAGILHCLDLYDVNFDATDALIDGVLLHYRNRIAHGERMDIDQAEYVRVVGEVIVLMDSVKTAIENAVATESYRVP